MIARKQSPKTIPVRVQRLVSACEGGADGRSDPWSRHLGRTNLLPQPERQTGRAMDVSARTGAGADLSGRGWFVPWSRKPDVQGGAVE